MKKVLLLLSIALISNNLFSQKNIHDFWFDSNESAIAIPQGKQRTAIVDSYRTLAVDLDGLKSALKNTPMEFTSAAKDNPKLVAIPLPNGENATFKVWESPVMSPILAAKFPEIKTYAGQGLDNPRLRIRFEIASKGFRGMLETEGGTVFIDPYVDGNNTDYVSYYKKNRTPNAAEQAVLEANHHFGEDPTSHLEHLKPITGGANSPFKSPTADGDPVELRVFKAAIASRGEFSQQNGGTVAAVMAEITYGVSRLNFIFEKETAVRFELVDNNDEIIFLDPDTDPYNGYEVSQGNGPFPSVLNQNINVLNNAIGEDNYDIGHLFSNPGCTSFGNGIAGVSGGTVCSNGKARGASCTSNPSDNFYFGVLAHEVGHQLSAAHPWNNCTPFQNGTSTDPVNPNPQISTGNAYEPGSGSTIMSYAGTCGQNNVQFGSDDYLHVNSIEAIYNYTREGAGDCYDLLTTDNIEPEVSIPFGNGVYIPISTPFQLTGFGTDANVEDTLTYCWEQYNLGPISPLGEPSGTAPSFRSYFPTENPTRYFPRMQTIVSNQNTAVEVLPTYSRDMTFRCTVRDSKWGGGGTVWEQISFDAVETAGPFLVEYPNDFDELEVGQYIDVTWDVANTDAAPVNCERVNILLSTNGGYDYNITLAENVPNTGIYNVLIPNAITNIARVKVEAADNIFFDISNKNFKIVAPSQPGFSAAAGPFFQKVCLPDEVVIDIQTIGLLDYDSLIQFEAIGLPADAVPVFSSNSVMPNENATLTISADNTPTADGFFDFQIMAFVPNEDTIYFDLTYETVATDFSDMVVTSPLEGEGGFSELPTYTWVEGNAADNYSIEISNDPSFSPSSIVETDLVTGGIYDANFQLDLGGIYWWRIRPQNECGVGEWTPAQAFAVKALSCTTKISDDGPITISSNGLPVIESTINIPTGGTISDLNISSIKGNHNAFKDIAMRLKGPDGTTVVQLFHTVFCQATQMDFGMDDEAAAQLGVDCPVNTGISYLPENPLSAFDGLDAAGDWILEVEVVNTAGSGGKLDEWTLQICSEANLSPPALVTNDTMPLPPGQSRGITSEFLLTQDPNNSAEEIIYTIVSLPENGSLFFLSTELGIGDQFAQNSSSVGNVIYVHDGSATDEDDFTFTVTDGEGGLIATPKFNIVIDPDVMISTDDLWEQNDISIFPNPASDIINIGFSQPINERVAVRIFNVQGQLLAEKIVANSQDLIQMNTSNFANGIYMVQVRTENASLTERVTVQK